MKNIQTTIYFDQQFIYNRVQNIWEKLSKSRKSCNQKLKINGIYNEKLRYNCL